MEVRFDWVCNQDLITPQNPRFWTKGEIFSCTKNHLFWPYTHIPQDDLFIYINPKVQEEGGLYGNL